MARVVLLSETRSTANRVVIADDHARLRGWLVEALGTNGFEVCGIGQDADGAVELVATHQPDICVLDIRMPGGGIEAARSIHESWPDVAIVMLTVSRDDEDLLSALSSGARGYLLKGLDAAALASELRRVVGGEVALDRSLVIRLVELANSRRGRRLDRRATLSDREREVLDMLVAGCSTNTIAERLFIAPVTVRSHISAMLKKLESHDRNDLVTMFSD